MGMFVCVHCCVQHVKIDCMYTFCQSTLICGVQFVKRQVQQNTRSITASTEGEFYTKEEVSHTNVQRYRTVVVQYISGFNLLGGWGGKLLPQTLKLPPPPKIFPIAI